jgi:protein-S-isoprenylcysteine O-methyltransferase Ste14
VVDRIMSGVHAVIVTAWACFLAYWLISARSVKKTAHRKRSWASGLGIALVGVGVGVLAQAPGLAPFLQRSWFPRSFALDAIAIALCIAGLAFAIVARAYLGSNWSSQPALKEGHELVTSGPYRYVRHPIYTGILLALLGTVLPMSAIFAAIWIAALVTFLVRIRIEEALMTRQFPDQYPYYKRRTKRLIPFLW